MPWPVQARAHPMPCYHTLAVGDFAQRSAILTGDPDRMTALLGQTGVIPHQHARLSGAPAHQLAQAEQHGRMIPRTLIDELLDRLVVASDSRG